MRRAVTLLPLLAAIATFGFFAVDKQSEASSVFSSGRGLAVVVALVAGYAVVGFLVRKFAPPVVAPLVMTAAVIGLAAWTVLPYYQDTTANETLVAADVSDASELTTATTTAAPPAADSGPASSPGAQTAEARPAAMMSKPPATSPQPAPAAAAVRRSTGNLKGIDHGARGSAAIIQGPDGRLIVRFTDFAVEGAPDPVVYLIEGNDQQRPGGVKLGKLAGNRGSQLDVAVPEGQAGGAGAGWTVLIWCERFAVPIANATQQAA